jgi:hypothetical protein
MQNLLDNLNQLISIFKDSPVLLTPEQAGAIAGVCPLLFQEEAPKKGINPYYKDGKPYFLRSEVLKY